MVQVISTNNGAQIQSIKELPEVIYVIATTNDCKKRIAVYCKDTHIHYLLEDYKDDNKTRHFKSTVAIPLPATCEIDEIIALGKSIEKQHEKLLDFIGNTVNEVIRKQTDGDTVAFHKARQQKNEDHLGMFYQSNGEFVQKKDDKTIGVCIISNYREDVIMSLEEKEITYEEASKEKQLPTYTEMIIAYTNYPRTLGFNRGINYYWIKAVNGYVNAGFGSVVLRSYYSADSNGGIGSLFVEYYPDGRGSNCGSRLVRKVKRIKK